MNDRLNWERDGRDWPNREASRFVAAGGVRFHVQVMGSGPPLLLLHGTGAATHSWRAFMPALGGHFTVIAPDLPGHGFTTAPPRDHHSLPGMALAVAALLDKLGIVPVIVAGHSAGAAILLHLAMNRRIAPRGIVGLNAALLPIGGVASPFLAPIGKLIARGSLLPQLFSWHVTDENVVRRLLRGTGSTIEPEGVVLYRKVMKNPHHAAAALAMMAHWDLRPLQHDLPRLAPRLLLIVGSGDRTIPPDRAGRVSRMVPGTEVVVLPGLGHLAHEEKPDDVAAHILRFAQICGVTSPP